jgi:MYXO-CTERM domain-containing protein
VEFSGGPYDCNPCTGVYPDGDQLADLGFTGNFDDHYMTRLHMRYTAAQAYQDLVFYASGIQEPDVLSYADDASINDCVEARCDGTPYGDGDADTDTDADTDADADADSDLDDGGEYGGGADCGCDSSGAPVGLAGLIALGLVRRRRSG